MPQWLYLPSLHTSEPSELVDINAREKCEGNDFRVISGHSGRSLYDCIVSEARFGPPGAVSLFYWGLKSDFILLLKHDAVFIDRLLAITSSLSRMILTSRSSVLELISAFQVGT